MRRELLLAILGAVVGGTAVVVTRAQECDPVIGRYVKVIRLQKKLYATNQRARALREKMQARGERVFYSHQSSTDTPLGKFYARINREADDVLRFAMDNFTGPQDDEATWQVDDLFARRLQPDTMTVEGLQKLLDVVIPVAIAKHMLSKERVLLNTMKMTQFDLFAQRYKEIILSGKPRPIIDCIRLYPEWADEQGYSIDKNGEVRHVWKPTYRYEAHRQAA